MKQCRSCGSELSTPFLDLGNSPISNSYLPEKNTHIPEIYYPLELYYCESCHLVQIDEFQLPDQIFSSDYAYYSSYSTSWLKHCKKYVEDIVERIELDKNSLVVEIGSNDGCLLQYFKPLEIPVKGIEPAKNTALVAISKNIPTDTVFFNCNYARSFPSSANLIVGNNVIAHNPDLNDFVEGLKIMLKPNGTITMEFPHLLQLIKNNQFDTIYQEHYSYFSLNAIHFIFNKHGLAIFDVEDLPTHGGSLRIYAKHMGSIYKTTKRFQEILDLETEFGLLDIETYTKFGTSVEKTKMDLLNTLIKIKKSGKSIVGYGAPAKGNTLLNYCGIRKDFIKYTVDINPYKQGLFLPGTHIPIKHPNQIEIDRPDYVLILPWNLQTEIMDQISFIKSWGGKFIVPLPTVKII